MALKISNNHKHRARIFLHRGDLIQAHAACEAAVADDRASNNQRELSNSLGNFGNACALMHDFDTAEQCYHEVLALQRTNGTNMPSPTRWLTWAVSTSAQTILRRLGPITSKCWICSER